MTRSSFQKGYVFPRETEHGKVHVIRYRVRSVDGRWKHKAETVNSPRRKDAQKILAERLREVNRGLKLPVETSFQQFSADHWETYVSQNLKPSTQASHRSNLRTHLLPAFGKLRLSEISPLQIMDLLKEKEASGLKPKSRLNLYVLLQKMLNLAVALELLSTNPIRRVPKPRVERSPLGCLGRILGLGWKWRQIVLLENIGVNRKSKSVLETEQSQLERFAGAVPRIC